MTTHLISYKGKKKKKGRPTRQKAKHHTGALHQNNFFRMARIFSCYHKNMTALQKLINCILGAGVFDMKPMPVAKVDL